MGSMVMDGVGDPVSTLPRPRLQLSHCKKIPNSKRQTSAIRRAFVRCHAAHFINDPFANGSSCDCPGRQDMVSMTTEAKPVKRA